MPDNCCTLYKSLDLTLDLTFWVLFPGAAAIRAAKVSEACNKKEKDDDEMGEEGLEQNVTIKEFPSYFKVLTL